MNSSPLPNRRQFLHRAGSLGLACAGFPLLSRAEDAADIPRQDAAALMTPATNRAIESGLRYLSQKQIKRGKDKGGFGSSGYSGSVGIGALAQCSMMSVDAPLLQIAGLHKRFGETVALQGVELNVRRGEVVCIIGPSGCGKSTLLRCINWLEAPDHGEVVLAGEVVGMQAREGAELSGKQHRALNAVRARMGMVFQQFNVWPHLSVLENVVRAQL
ncbi:MAG: ATP-binding cassette domain-containing protein, partial [Verrucomicrobiota bacterium]